MRLFQELLRDLVINVLQYSNLAFPSGLGCFNKTVQLVVGKCHNVAVQIDLFDKVSGVIVRAAGVKDFWFGMVLYQAGKRSYPLFMRISKKAMNPITKGSNRYTTSHFASFLNIATPPYGSCLHHFQMRGARDLKAYYSIRYKCGCQQGHIVCLQ